MTAGIYDWYLGNVRIIFKKGKTRFFAAIFSVKPSRALQYHMCFRSMTEINGFHGNRLMMNKTSVHAKF